jgi:lipid A disaccharide synthetase
MSLADLQGHESDLVVDGRAVLNLPEQDPERGGIRTLSGMNLELLSVSSLAITGVGAISIECGLMGLPFVPILPRKPAQTSPQVMLNQVLGRSLVPEYHAEQSEDELFEAASLLMTKGPVRDTMQRELETVARELQGYAAENAVEYIGREIALWKQATTKKAKGTKSA